jgi:transposase
MMTIYHNFIGIDISKPSFFVAVHGQNKVKEYDNTPLGINAFLQDHANTLKEGLCILETTGGYELELLYTLCSQGYAVHRANTRKVKNFIRSYGNGAKTDQMDAQALARYGAERYSSLQLFVPQSIQALDLFELVQRRLDLKKMLVSEKNRLQAPCTKVVQQSCHEIITTLNQQVDLITQQIKNIIQHDKVLSHKMDILKTIPGIGDIIAFELLVLLPELGQLNRKQIASLAGLAPIANDSGKYQGYRKTGHGRNHIKPILFTAAMAARNSKSNLKAFYEKLIAKGKQKMVALTALMRKIITIANARLKKANLNLKHSLSAASTQYKSSANLFI